MFAPAVQMKGAVVQYVCFHVSLVVSNHYKFVWGKKQRLCIYMCCNMRQTERRKVSLQVVAKYAYNFSCLLVQTPPF